MLVLVEDQGTRSDERHLRAENVEELRQFVERVAAKDPADGRDSRIVRDLEHARVLAGQQVLVHVLDVELPQFGVGVHRPELVDAERPASGPHPHLPEEHRAP